MFSIAGSCSALSILKATLVLVFLTESASTQKVTLESPVMKPGGVMSKRYTAYGKDLSPPLVWSNIPSQARELALIFEDVESTRVHWLLYRIPVTAPGLREAVPQSEVISEPAKISGTIQGLTDFRDQGPGYHGPNPQAGEVRRYRFLLYALDARLGLLPGLDRVSLMSLISSHIIGEGELIVTSKR
ncbi:MAG TPA: YbhB/YbcL family Raf kinase inhibitor-like protein [Acidobacteriota bacterium]|nr:YbhB/YbcL family Raf kinase inhibitor-like protein [Acidobacteriota bacterium]